MHGEALARVPDGRGGHVAEAECAVALQGQDPGVRCGRHHGAQHAGRNAAAVLLHEGLQTRRTRPAAEPGDRDRLVAVREMNDHRRHAGELHLIGVHDAERDPGGDARVDHVASGLEHGMTGLGGQVMAGRDHVARAGDHRLQRHSGLPCVTGAAHGVSVKSAARSALGLRSSAWSRTASAAARGSSTTGPACADSRRPRRSSPDSSRPQDSSGLVAGPECRVNR